MEFNFTEILFALSDALDHVEHDLIGVTTFHGKRVAAIAGAIGKEMGMKDEQLLDLMGCAILHDCALTEYVQTEYRGSFIDAADAVRNAKDSFKMHCIKGEEHVSSIPFYGDVTNVVLNHHENADGSGLFHKEYEEIPLQARLIHLADQLDAIFDLSIMNREKYENMTNYLMKNRNTIFDQDVVYYFEDIFDYQQCTKLRNEKVGMFLHDIAPSKMRACTPEELVAFSRVFAVIVDYKSHFTKEHSIGIAQKAYEMGLYYGVSREMAAKLYFAGALHDIGKLIIDRDVLEKPDKLTDKEYQHIQTHAYATYTVLGSIKGLEDITRWASYHHEKLNGKGYPFALKADQLDQWDRLLGCLDIYQALTETRPYKEGMTHEKAMSILLQMAEDGFLDIKICEDINKVFPL